MSITFTNFDNYVEVTTPEANLILLKNTINLVCTADYSSMTLSTTGSIRSSVPPQLYTGYRISVADISSPTGSSNKDVVRQIQEMLTNEDKDYGAFHDTLMFELNPISQAQAVYGLREKMETFTATGGSVSASNNLFTCQTGTSVGGYGVIRTLRQVVYKPGQGLLCRGTAMFDADNALANSYQTFGMFNATDGVLFGYLGTNYGIIHEYGGRLEIQTLTISAAASGAETATVTINGTIYTIPITAGTTAHNAWEIDQYLEANIVGWSVEQASNTVIIMSASDGNKTGTFAFSSTGTATGSWTENQAGVTKTRDFIPQADWNQSTGGWINKDKLTIYEIIYPYLGDGDIIFKVWNSNAGRHVPVHIIYRNSLYTTTSTGMPTFRAGWVAASLGSSGTNLTVKGGSCAIFIEGRSRITEEPRGLSASASIGTTLTNLLTIKARLTFNNRQCLAYVKPNIISVGSASSKQAVFEIYENADIGEYSYAYVNQSESIVKYTTVNNSISGGRYLTSVIAGPNGTAQIDMTKLDYILLPGYSLSIGAKVTSGASSDLSVSISWQEDI